MKVCIKFKNGINFMDEGISINYHENTSSIDFSKMVENKKYGSFIKTYSFHYSSINEVIVDGIIFDNRMKPIEIKQIEITMKSHLHNSNEKCAECIYYYVPFKYYPCKACIRETSFYVNKRLQEE